LISLWFAKTKKISISVLAVALREVEYIMMMKLSATFIASSLVSILTLTVTKLHIKSDLSQLRGQNA